MIRKAIIVMLTFGVAVTGVTWGLSYVVTGEVWDDGRDAKGFSWGSPYAETDNLFFAVTMGRIVIIKGSKWDYDAQRWTKGAFWDRASFCIVNDPRAGGGSRVRGVQLPMWSLFTLLATYPTIAFIRGPLRRWRRRRRGLCVACGYDLTGNVTGVCSECGEEVTKAP